VRERIPDPQDPGTFERSKLDWDERIEPPHDGVLALTRRLLQLRASEAALQWSERASQRTRPAGEDAIVLQREHDGATILLVAHLRGGAATVDVPELADSEWTLVLTTEDAEFAAGPAPIEVEIASGRCAFARPGAVLFRRAEV
jgi:maltooligosyltrehalose trehalohydrolase